MSVFQHAVGGVESWTAEEVDLSKLMMLKGKWPSEYPYISLDRKIQLSSVPKTGPGVGWEGPALQAPKTGRPEMWWPLETDPDSWENDWVHEIYGRDEMRGWQPTEFSWNKEKPKEFWVYDIGSISWLHSHGIAAESTTLFAFWNQLIRNPKTITNILQVRYILLVCRVGTFWQRCCDEQQRIRLAQAGRTMDGDHPGLALCKQQGTRTDSQIWQKLKKFI